MLSHFHREDLDAIEKEMKKIIKEGRQDRAFYKIPERMPSHILKEKNEPYKVELIEDLPEGEEISFYSQGDWIDLCAGPHLMSTKGIKAFKLLSSSRRILERRSRKSNADSVSTELLMQQRMS